MWVLLVLVSVFLLLAPIAFAIRALSRVGELTRRIARIEAAVDRLALNTQSPPRADAEPLDQAEKSFSAETEQEDPEPSTSVPALDAGAAARPAAPIQTSIEERLGARWAVWAGGAALALGGLLLVRYSIEAGLLGPEFRVAAGALLAAGLIVAGEWMRRGEVAVPAAYIPQAHIPSIITAAGTVVAFGTIYAAHALYGFIGAGAAFGLLGATGVITMLASALHGPWLAGLGLAASFATPLLVSSDAPSPWPVVLYLSVVTAAAYALARVRRWKWLALSTVAGAVVWGWLLIGASGAPGDATVIAAAVFTFVQLSLAAVFLGIEPHAGRRDADAIPDRFATGAMGALTTVGVLVVFSPALDFNSRQTFAAASVALLVATAWRSASVATAASLGAILSLAALVAWPDLELPPDVTLTAPLAEGVLRLPDNASRFLAFAALTTMIPAAVITLRLWRAPLLTPLTAAFYAAAATVPPLLALILAYLRITQFDVSIPFAVAGAALTVSFAAVAERFHRADQSYSSPAFDMAAGIFGAAAFAALALALTMSLERGYLTLAFALATLGAAYISANRDLVPLRIACAALGLIVLARVAYDPRIMGDGVGATPIFNWLLLGYGAPAIAFYVSARLLQSRRDDFAVRVSDALAAIFVGLLAFFQIRHLTNNGDVLHEGGRLVEAGLQTFVALALSFALARMNMARANPVFDAASLVYGAASLVFAAGGLFVFANPLFTGDAIEGWPLLSSLSLGYLLPGVGALAVARQSRGMRPQWYIRAAGLPAIALLTAYVTLAVRHAFQGPSISIWRSTSDAEYWAYSAAWLILGVLFLGYGLLRGSLEARAASAALIVLTAVKITLFDLAGIGGVWRALSFLSLGAVLIGIGLVYQKLIFAAPAEPQSDP